MISKILVVDDSVQDRKSVRKAILKANNSIEVIEANSLVNMYRLLDGKVDMLIQDISLNNSDAIDSSGLNALYDVIENYPILPIIILTGHYFDKVKEYHSGYIRKSGHIIDYLDKADYDSDTIKRVIFEANNFIISTRKRTEENKAIDDMLTSLAVLELQNKELVAKSREVDKLKLYAIAYNRDVTLESISAEATLTGGYSHYNAIRLCINIERTIKHNTTHLIDPNFNNRLYELTRRYPGIYANRINISNSWKTRNMIVHEAYKPHKNETIHLFETYSLLYQLQ